MDHYIELSLRPDPELSPAHVMAAVYAKLHRELVRSDRADIGVSFPRAGDGRAGLGNTLRLHGNAVALGQLTESGWLDGMRDYVDAQGVQRVPEQCRYRRVSRVQAKSSPERLRRRQMRRHGIDAQTAAARVPDSARETLRLPYIRLGSGSTGQQFLLFIAHGPLQEQPTQGQFNAYGLSQQATIPWF